MSFEINSSSSFSPSMTPFASGLGSSSQQNSQEPIPLKDRLAKLREELTGLYAERSSSGKKQKKHCDYKIGLCLRKLEVYKGLIEQNAALDYLTQSDNNLISPEEKQRIIDVFPGKRQCVFYQDNSKIPNRLIFKTDDPNSAFSGFVLSKKDNIIFLKINFKEHCEELSPAIKNYFTFCGIAISQIQSRLGFYVARDPKEVQILLAMLDTQNISACKDAMDQFMDNDVQTPTPRSIKPSSSSSASSTVRPRFVSPLPTIDFKLFKAPESGERQLILVGEKRKDDGNDDNVPAKRTKIIQ